MIRIIQIEVLQNSFCQSLDHNFFFFFFFFDDEINEEHEEIEK